MWSIGTKVNFCCPIGKQEGVIVGYDGDNYRIKFVEDTIVSCSEESLERIYSTESLELAIEELKKIKEKVADLYDNNKFFGVEEYEAVARIINCEIKELEGEKDG